MATYLTTIIFPCSSEVQIQRWSRPRPASFD